MGRREGRGGSVLLFCFTKGKVITETGESLIKQVLCKNLSAHL